MMLFTGVNELYDLISQKVKNIFFSVCSQFIFVHKKVQNEFERIFCIWEEFKIKNRMCIFMTTAIDKPKCLFNYYDYYYK